MGGIVADGLYWVAGENAIAHAYEVNVRGTRVRLRWIDEHGIHRRRGDEAELTPIDPMIETRCPTLARALRDPEAREMMSMVELEAAAFLMGASSRAAQRLADARASMASGRETLIHVVGNCIVVATGPERDENPASLH